MKAEERREFVLEAAALEFARSGLHGTSAEAIADRAGISQPYIFRLFGTKRELFLAVVDRSFDHLLAALTEAVESADGDAVIPALEVAFERALTERDGQLLHMQLYAACGDDEVRRAVRARFAECYRYVERAVGADSEEVRALFGRSLLRSVAAAMRLEELSGREAWAQRLLGPS